MEPNHQRIPFDDNRRTFLTALSYLDGQTAVPLYGDPSTHELLVETTVSTGALPGTLRNGQQTVTTSAVALPAGALTQGVILESLSTNTVSIFIGNSSVTTSNGTELTPGSSVSVAVNNINLIYVICASSSPIITWIGS